MTIDPANAAHSALRAQLLQAMRTYLEQAESPHISLADFCALAGVSEVGFRFLFQDIRQLQMELILGLADSDFLSRELANTAQQDLLRRFQALLDQYWPIFGKPDFGLYERNLLRLGLVELYQQAEESAVIARECRNSYVEQWLVEAMRTEGLRPGVSSTGLADFRASMQISLTVAPTFDERCSYRNGADTAHRLWMRYLQRHLHKQEAA